MNELIRVALVDDDPFVRASLATILSADDSVEICGEAGNGKDAIALYADVQPDILLMDIQMPTVDEIANGLDAATEILQGFPDARIVFLTTFSDEEYLKTALRLGSKGYLIKQEVGTLLPALRSVMAGQVVLGSEIPEKMGALLADKDASSDKHVREQAARDGLSEREFQVLELIASGQDNKEVAAELFVSEGTARNYVSNILQKLALKNRTQLASYYHRALGQTLNSP
ncbi:MAG: response regulator transcription factor [Coriobacteriia bacterium]|nr:response regulator transcription factor [Coriobacteriia bacterium]